MAAKKDKSFFDIATENAKKYGPDAKDGSTTKAGLKTFVDTPIEGVKAGVRKAKTTVGVCKACHGTGKVK